VAASTLPDTSKVMALAHSRCALSASSSVAGVTTAGAAGGASTLPGDVSTDEEGAADAAVDKGTGAEGTSPSRSTLELLPAVLTARGSIAKSGRRAMWRRFGVSDRPRVAAESGKCI
jgi:hypothetical protein